LFSVSATKTTLDCASYLCLRKDVLKVGQNGLVEFHIDVATYPNREEQTKPTLAYDGRRGAFFENQLVAALTILQNGDVAARSITKRSPFCYF
jgi:hypothetical protein